MVRCNCGYFEKVTEPEGGQSLVGTAANKSMRHNGACSMSSDVEFPGGLDITEQISSHGGFRKARHY